jgi:hypothetical protein
MSYRIDHDEPIPKLIERLKREHRELEPKLDHILELSESGKLLFAESTLLSISQEILRHAVEEEARIIQVIADNAKGDLERSTEVMRHHRRIEEFLQDFLVSSLFNLNISILAAVSKSTLASTFLPFATAIFPF